VKELPHSRFTIRPIDDLIAEGWRFFSPKISFPTRAWTLILSVFGKLNRDYIVLVSDTEMREDGEYITGRLVISPRSLRRAACYVKIKRK
jgi:hypothetical protein